MLAPQIKKKVDALWNKFWTAGITNPLVAIEQITYLLFLKRLEDLDNARVKNSKPSIYQDTEQNEKRKAEQCRWSYIKQDKTPKHLLDVVFPWLRELEKKFVGDGAPTNGVEAIGNRMSDAYFQLDLNKGAILGEAIDLIDALFARVDTIGAAADVMGDTFEYLLSEIATAGKNGQFRTSCNQQRGLFEKEESPAWPVFQRAFQSALDRAVETLTQQATTNTAIEAIEYDATVVAAEARRIAREFAKLDGYDVMLQTLQVNKRAEPLTEPKSWRAPVRVYAHNDA